MLEVRNVSKSFGRRQGQQNNALENINLTIDTSEIVSLVGTSGCGKSTLLRIISGLTQPSVGADCVHGGNPDLGGKLTAAGGTFWPRS